MIASPTVAAPTLVSTWSLLRMNSVPERFIKAPRVPTQQAAGDAMLVLFTFDPEVPNFTGAVWAVDVSLG